MVFAVSKELIFYSEWNFHLTSIQKLLLKSKSFEYMYKI